MEPHRPTICMIVARSSNGAIGKNGTLPWHLPADLRHFKRLTVGKPVIMGRKTYESIGKPLPGRHNIVITRNADWRADGVTVVANIAEAIAATGLDPRARADEIMIIGGADIYAQCLNFTQKLYLTDVHRHVDGDAFFPVFDDSSWQETAHVDHAAVAGNPAYSMRLLSRVD
jgi:dihydrofolate reductase